MPIDIGTYQDALVTPPVIDPGVTLVGTSGYFVEGDGGGAPFVMATSEPPDAAKFQDADGRWFGIAVWQRHLAEMFGAIGDGITDDAAAINAALASPAVTILLLLSRVYRVGTAIIIPSGKTIAGEGIGATVLMALSGLQDTQNNTAVIRSENAQSVEISSLTIDVNQVGLNEGSTKRTNGLALVSTIGYFVENVRVTGATGYGLWSNGNNDVVNSPSSGTFAHCYADDCQICFEQGASDGVLLEDCHATASGDEGSVPCTSFFHPLIGSRNITYRDCTGLGSANAGIDPQADGTVGLGRIFIDNARIELSRGGVGLSCAPGQPNGIELIQISDSLFRADNGIGAQFRDVEVRASQSEFRGSAGVVGYDFGGEFANCTIAGESDTVGAKGIVANSLMDPLENLRVRGGTVSALGPDLGPAYSIAIAGAALVDVDADTIVTPPQVPSRIFGVVAVGTNTTVTAHAGNYYTVEKTGGVNHSYDASAVSTSSFSGNLILEIIPKALGTFVAGLSLNPAGAGASTTDCGFNPAADGTLYRTELGAGSALSIYQPGQSLWLRRRGSFVEYIKGGSDPSLGEIIRVITLDGPLYFDCSIYDFGAAFDVRIWQ